MEPEPCLAGAQDVPELARVLAAAFDDDPPFVWLMPDPATRPEQLRRFFEIELRTAGLARGAVWTTPDRAGVAISVGPGKWGLPISGQLRHGRNYQRAFRSRLPQALGLQTRMQRLHPRWAHHYLPFIGVAPERQGRGLGTALMAPTLQECDRSRLAAYLEASNERSAALYARLGFAIVDELEYGGTQPLRLMLRVPATGG